MKTQIDENLQSILSEQKSTTSPLPVLPEKYYLAHFFELLDILETDYFYLLEQDHLDFLRDFRNLSESAQCVYVRMVNRKGLVFQRAKFLQYFEITEPLQALSELKARGFGTGVTSDDLPSLVLFLRKAELQDWLAQVGVATNKMSRDALVQIAMLNISKLQATNLPPHLELIVQRKSELLEYLMFLYFGRWQETLTLYTLRDLGIRKTQTLKGTFKPRFENMFDAKAEYFFSKIRAQLPAAESKDWASLIANCVNRKVIKTSSRALKSEVLIEIAALVEDHDVELSLRALAHSEIPPGRERLARLLLKLNRKDQCLTVLEDIQKNPWSDEELLFAEDFLARRYEKKKLGCLTEALRGAREITLSDVYINDPELGVQSLLASQGQASRFTENRIWNELFGLVFWTELFENQNSGIHNPFDRNPSDLVGTEFFDKHVTVIEEKLNHINDFEFAKNLILDIKIKNEGKLNGIFLWHEELSNQIIEFLRLSTGKNLSLVLRRMAHRYDLFHSGFPDLLVEKNGEAAFIEVKAEGDVVRMKQLSKVRLLQEAGYSVEILRVKWGADPNQVYVVVDVETTGGAVGAHRITEVGAVKLRGQLVVDEFQSLVNPERPIPKFISQLTGITNQMVADAPKFAELAQRFEEFTDGAVFVAHNVRFDYGFIRKEFERLGRDFRRPQLCTVTGMKKAFPGLESYGLKKLTDHFQIQMESHHRALSDAHAAARLFILMAQKRQQQ